MVGAAFSFPDAFFTDFLPSAADKKREKKKLAKERKKAFLAERSQIEAKSTAAPVIEASVHTFFHVGQPSQGSFLERGNRVRRRERI